MRFRPFLPLSCLLLLLTLLLVSTDAAVAGDNHHGKQSNGLLSFFTGPNRTTAKPVADSSSSTSNAISSLTNGIQSIQNLSFQNLIDATGITRLTDPIFNQARKRWQQFINR